MGTFLVFLGIIVVGASRIKAEDCITEILKPQMNDSSRGLIYSRDVSTTAVTSISSWTVRDSSTGIETIILQSYFNFNISDGSFNMYTTTDFESFSKNAYSSGLASATVEFEILFNCNSDAVNMYLLIQDSLSYPPTFSKSEYIYIVPMPITKYSDFTLNNGDDVVAEEINFSNTGMSFTIEPDHFEVSATQTSNKKFKASFQARELYQFTQNQTYTLTATNSAGNQSTVQLTIAIDSEEGLDTPLFNQPYYLYELSDNILISKSEAIEVTSGKPNTCTYELKGDYASFFTLKFDNETAQFDLSTSSASIGDVSGQIFLSLFYTTDATTTTAIIVNIIDVIPIFSQDIYKGVYDATTNEISWLEPVTVFSAVEVKVDDDVSNLFTVDQSDYSIKPIEALSENDFDDNFNIIFTLTAVSSTKNETKAVVLVSIKTEQVSKELQFDNVLYKAKYELSSDTATVTLDADSKIGFKNLTDFTGIEISVDSDFKQYFEVVLTNEVWSVNVKNKLTETILSNSELIVSLTANKTSDGSTAEAVLVVSLPELPYIEFEKPYYKATYKQNDNGDEVILDEDIKIIGADGLDDFSIVVEGYEDNLKANCIANGSCQIDVITKIDFSTWNDRNSLTLTVIGSGTKNSILVSNYTVLVLEIPSANQTKIKFNNTYYLANYIKSSEGNTKDVVELLDGQVISIENKDQIDVSFEFDAYANNFELSCNNKTWTCSIIVTNNLDESILESSFQLELTIIAKASKENVTDHTVLIVSLPVSKASSIEFEEIHYSAQYIKNADGENDTVNLSNEGIILKNSDNLTVEFSFESYNDIFDLVFDQNTSSYQVNLKSNLDDSVLASNSQLVLTITATALEGSVTNHTVLVLDLPNANNSEIIFEKTHYSANYILSSDGGIDSVELLDGPISLKNPDDLAVEFTLESYNEVLNLVCVNKSTSCSINVFNNLDKSVLTANSQLILTITATAGGDITAHTVLILSLPDTEDANIEFEESYYFAEYIKNSGEEKDSVSFPNGDMILKNADNLTIQFSFDLYNDVFQLVYDQNTSSCKISLNSNLDELVLASSSQLVFTITATALEGNVTNHTVLILELPITNSSAIIFEKSHYTAKYIPSSDGGNDSVELLDGPITLESPDDLNIQFSWENYNDIFELVCVTNWTSCGISVKSNLDSTILADNSQLILTLTAAASNGNVTDHTVLILSLPVSEAASIEFGKAHYFAEYIKNSEGVNDTVRFPDGGIILKNSDSLTVQFSFESYNEIFDLVYDQSTTLYKIDLKANLGDSILTSNSQLVLTITATALEGSLTNHTVLVLDLPTTNGSKITFDKSHYSAKYILNSDGESDSVELLDGPINLQNPDDLSVGFSFESYSDALNVVCINSTTSCSITVINNMDDSVFAENTQLILTITATASGANLKDHTVLILDLPSSNDTDAVIEFEQDYYSARYVSDSDGTSLVSMESSLITLKNEDDLDVTFNIDDYESIFELTCQTKTSLCSINVISNLSTTLLSTENQLIFTITAVALQRNLTSKTVLILDLPGNPHDLQFGKSYYSAVYQPHSLKLDEILTLSSHNYDNITFSFESYQEHFEVEYLTDVGTYSVGIKEPLNDTILTTITEIIVVLVVNNNYTGDAASTALAIKLPLYLNDVFKSDHYEFEYLQSDASNAAGLQILGDRIKIKSPEYTNLIVPGYEEYISGSCDDTTLDCILVLQRDLNDTTLSSTELLVSLVASTPDHYSTGKSVLLLNLPPKNSTFAFTKSYFRANYSIQPSDTELASLTLLDVISLEGAYTSGTEIIAEGYSDYLRFTLSVSEWTVEVVKNLEESVLSESRQIVTSLIATSTDGTSSAKATLIIQLPDESTIYFYNSYYYGDYDSDSQQITLAENSQIEISDLQNTLISFESMSDYLGVSLNETTWQINTKQPLNSTILTQYSELNIEMVIKKAGVSYGKATLVIGLPSLHFSEDFYNARYLVDDNGNVNVTTGQINIKNIDENYVNVKLTNWTTYFSVSLANGSCTVEIIQTLPPDITNNYRTLVTNLVVTRQVDGQTLATSTLIITLADVDSTDTPNFAQFTFYGEYKNSDIPTVSLDEPIKLTYDSQAVLESIRIDPSSGKFASNFELTQEDYNTYTVNVLEPLSQDTIEAISNIVLTLVATSTQNKSSYAALVIELPKALRNSSIQVENQEVLFTGTYEDGVFTSPRIKLEFSNSTEDEDVTVDITNDLGIDDDYFHYTYANHSLTISMDALPEDVLSNVSMITLKLAITDTSTQDTAHAVVNVKVGNGSASLTENSHQGALVGLIVAVSILAVLLGILLLAAFAYWFFKLRKSSDSDEEATPTSPSTTIFTKNESKKTVGSGQLRRPTGLAVGIPSPIAEDSSTDNPDLDSDDSSELDKKVAFNDNVEQIHTTNDDDDHENLQSVADRRPTTFVFGNPLENGLNHLSDDRRESSDYNSYDIPEERRRSLGLDHPDSKKAVAFDENVERMHIDTIEANEEEESDEDSDEGTDTPDSYKAEAKVHVNGDKLLTSL